MSTQALHTPCPFTHIPHYIHKLITSISSTQEFLRREVKPKTKDELVNGILHFWSTVTLEKFCRYISYLDKVIPEIIRVNGEATGF